MVMHMGEVETMVEDNMEEEEDHSEPPWSSHPRTWWSALAISSRFPVEELVRWRGAGKVLPSHPLTPVSPPALSLRSLCL